MSTPRRLERRESIACTGENTMIALNELVRLFKDRKGAIAVTTALSLSAMLGIAALGTEGASWYATQRHVQKAADAAAASASVAYLGGNTTSYQTIATSVAGANGFVNGQNGISVVVNRPPTKGNFTQNTSAIEVIITTPIQPLLSSLFLASAINVQGRGVAGPAPSANCFLALDPTSQNHRFLVKNQSTVDAPDCGIAANGLSDHDVLDVKDSSKLIAKSITLHAGYEYSSSATIQVMVANGIKTFQPVTADPYATRTIPTPAACNQVNLKVTASTTLQPGTYCGTTVINGSINVTLASGTYIFDGGNAAKASGLPSGAKLYDFSIVSGAKVSGSNVTLVLTTSTSDTATIGSVNIDTDSEIAISAPTSGNLSGMAIWQDGRASLAASKSEYNIGDANTNSIGKGSTGDINGVIYIPRQPVFWRGTSSGSACTQIIAYAIQFLKNSSFSYKCDTAGVTPITSTGGSTSIILE